MTLVAAPGGLRHLRPGKRPHETEILQIRQIFGTSNALSDMEQVSTCHLLRALLRQDNLQSIDCIDYRL